jgi:undecaprenyl-diphosphatase
MNPNGSNVLSLFLDYIIAWDHLFFVKINSLWSFALGDKVFPFITDLHKSPIGIALIAASCLFWMYKDKQRAWRFIVIIAIAVAAGDMISYRLIKPAVNRARPEQTQGLPLQLRVESSHSLSFPSNHATNMFAVAAILWFALPGYGWWAFAFAALIAYSRVYVGVHFPLDVIGGAFFGFVVGRIIWNFLGHWAEFTPPEEKSTRLKSYERSSRNPTGE